MNIVLLGYADIASKIALKRIVAAMPEHCFSLFLSGSLSSDAPLPGPLEKLGHIDRQFYESLPWDIGCEPRDLAEPNSPGGIATLRACEPDLFISVRYRRILRNEAIATPRHGVLNLHSGLLPEYKGVMATFWAMLNGKAEIGCTLHWIIDPTIDTGPVIGLSRMRTRADASYLANVLGLYPDGCAMMIDTVRKISSGKTVDASEQSGDGHYYSTPGADDLSRFFARGLRLADNDDLDEFIVAHEGRFPFI
jgi:methionyl-tRNA formyltransferase